MQKMKRLILITTLILAIAFSYYLGWKSAFTKILSTDIPTTVYIAKEKITLDNGSTIPKGTELIFDTHMPEGFSRLRLYINTESIDLFSIHEDPRTNLIIPYWIDDQTNNQTIQATRE